MSKFNVLMFSTLDRNDAVQNAIYNIWAECVFNEYPESDKVKITIDNNNHIFTIQYCYNRNMILDEKGHFYFTDDGTVVIYLDEPTHCQKFIAFERTHDYMEIAYM